MEKLLNRFFFLLLLLTLLTLLTAGCLKKPYYPGKDYGELRIRLVLAEETVMIRAETNGSMITAGIKKILIQLSHGKGHLTRTVEIPYSSDQPMETHLSSLYPGKWQVTAEACDEEGYVVLSASREVTIEPGSSNTTELYLTAAPGFLKFTFDASEFPGFGTEITEGKLYVYLDPKTNQSTSFSLTREGDCLNGLIKLPAGTYQVRVAVPQTTNKVYESPYYTVHIRPGRTEELTVGPCEELIIGGTIDFPPETPGQLALSPGEPAGSGSVIVHLSWADVPGADVGGYRLYRTNNEGRFVWLAEVGPDTLAYTDTVTPGAYYNGRVGYAVSSFDLGGNESLWSEPVYLDKP
ncbi:MAG: DUF4493 domain-containing protein [Clostridia bacterium]|nr:DUF4493 domain-containing protein [Clostridia bacterium]